MALVSHGCYRITTNWVASNNSNISSHSSESGQASLPGDCRHSLAHGYHASLCPGCHITGLLRSLYASQEATVRTKHGTTDWFKTGKGVCQGYVLSPCFINLYAEYIMGNPVWMKQKPESRLLGEISITSDMQMISPLW